MGISVDKKPLRITKIIEGVKKEKNKRQFSVGFYPKSTYQSGEYVAQVAFWNEYGTDIIPERPFFQQAINQMRSEYPNLYKKSIRQHTVTNVTLELIGNEFVNKIRQSIDGQFGEFAPNSTMTIKRKGSDKPLVDTGVLVASATFEIDDNGN